MSEIKIPDNIIAQIAKQYPIEKIHDAPVATEKIKTIILNNREAAEFGYRLAMSTLTPSADVMSAEEWLLSIDYPGFPSNLTEVVKLIKEYAAYVQQHNSAKSYARFLCTSAGFAKKLQANIEQEVIIIKMSGGGLTINESPYYPGDVSGIGEFVYSKSSITQLIKCLNSFSERPIVIRLEKYCICLDQIMF